MIGPGTVEVENCFMKYWQLDFVMLRPRFLLIFASMVLLFLEVSTAGPPGSSGSSAASRNWTADNGNGTYSNPLFYEEFEDPDVIRVGEDYYLAGTTMHMNPAVI